MAKMRRVIEIILMMAMLTMTVSEAFAADWYDANWNYRRMITIDHTRVQDVANPSSAYAEFPVLIYLTGLSNINVNGTDIRFTASDGTTELPREIESYSGGTLYAWVKVTLTRDSSDPSDDVIYMYYENSGASEPPPGSAYGSENVWDSNYLMVQHLNETTGTHSDSTSNSNDGTPINGVIQNATGQIDGADDFDGVNDYVDLGNSINLTQNFTVEAWINARSFPPTWPDWRTIIGDRWEWQLEVTDTSRVMFRRWGPYRAVQSTTALSTGQWYYVASTLTTNNPYDFNNKNLNLYLNGQLDNIGPIQTPLNTSTSTTLRISGRIQSDIEWFDGYIDEVRISNNVRSADWLKTSFDNQNAPGSFINSGSEISNTATVTWTGATNTDWNTPTNWDIGEVPADTHSVSIPNVANAPVLDTARTVAAITINGETLDLNGNSLNVTGNLTVAGSGVLNASAGSPIITVGGNWDSSAGIFIYGTSTIKMTGSPSKTLTLWRNSGWVAYAHNIIIDTGADVTYSPNSSVISGNLTINDGATFTASNNLGLTSLTGTLIMSASASLNLPGNFIIWDVSDTSPYLPTTGTITTSGSGAIVFCVAAGSTAARVTARSYNVDISIGGLALSDVAVLGGGTGTLDLNGHDLYLHDLSWNCGPATLDNLNDITIANGGTLHVADPANTGSAVRSGKLIARSATYNFASVNFYNTGEIDDATGSGISTWTVSGDVTFQHSNTTLNAGGASWSVGGNLDNSTSGTFTPGTSTVTFNGSSDQTVTSGGAAFNDFTLNNTASLIISDNLDVDGDMTVTDGNLDLDTNDPDVSTAGNVTIDTNGSVTSGTGTWIFDGTTDFTDNSSSGPQNLGTVVVD